MTTTDTTTTWVTTRDAADMLGVSAQAVYRLINRGTLRHRREGTTIKIPLDAVLARMEGKPDRTSVSRRSCQEFVLQAGQVEAVSMMHPDDVHAAAYAFIGRQRPEYLDEDRDRYANAMTAQLLAGQQ